MWSLLLMKLQAFRPASYYKDTPTQVFFCKIWEISKNTYFEEQSANDCFCQMDVFIHVPDELTRRIAYVLKKLCVN